MRRKGLELHYRLLDYRLRQLCNSAAKNKCDGYVALCRFCEAGGLEAVLALLGWQQLRYHALSATVVLLGARHPPAADPPSSLRAAGAPLLVAPIPVPLIQVRIWGACRRTWTYVL